MDRNYFLSYSQVALILLLSIIGKLNGRIISSAVGRSELMRCTDIKDTDHSPYLSDTFSQKTVIGAVCGSHHHTEKNDDFQYTVFEHSLQSNLPIANDRDFFLLSAKKINFVSVCNKWRKVNFAGHTDVLNVVKKVKRFYINSVKLIDGFKFIIKIPDKLNVIS